MIGAGVDGAGSPYTYELAALLFQLYGFRNRSGSLTIFTAIRRASSPPGVRVRRESQQTVR
jgi:hypothetical protein